jgi:hypothetical protein
MRPEIRLARPLVPQIGRYESINDGKGVFTPVRPGHAQLFVGSRERFAAVAQKLRPVQDSAGHAAGFGLGVQNMAQPEQTPVSGTESVTASQRPADLERRPDRQKCSH